MYAICPFGERRKDLRAAYHTAHLMAAASMSEVKADKFSETIQHLASYLKCDSDADDASDYDPAAMAIMKAT